MVNIFQATYHCSGILANEEVFRPQFFPKQPLHRDVEIKTLAIAIRPLIDGKTPNNLFVYGDSGTGKTALVRYVLQQLNEHTRRTKTIFVNCWQCHTRMSIYSLIAEAIGEVLPRRGLATDEVFARIMEMMQKENHRIVIVLDELDGLLFHGEEKLLYDLTRAGTGKPLFGIIGISNNENLLRGLDQRIESSLSFIKLGIRHYTKAQIAEILTERARIGLTPGSWDMGTINACASHSATRNGHMHFGMDILLKAAKEAQTTNKRRIGPDDIEMACSARDGNGHSADSEVLPSSLNDGERLVLEILKQGEIDSTSLYALFNRKKHMGIRQIRNYIKTLEARDLILTRDMVGLGPIGLKKLIRLR